MIGIIVNGVWQPGIGDPTFMGWAITIGYLASAVSCAAVAIRDALRQPRPATRHTWRFWVILSAMLLLLGLNKQLDLQTWLWLAGRSIAREQGWYEQRRWVQVAFTAGIAISGIVLLAALFKFSYLGHGRYLVALTGVTFLVCFIVIRTISIENVDRFLGIPVGPMNVNRLLEAAGIVLVLAASLYANARRSNGTDPAFREGAARRDS
ncbi:MAG: hypothetical protein IT365_03040 [Candidatus Hydrogenedentes bacterium]|nr:hypothetical protein [Candidatus Hydrogenedentota bacterium]